MLITYEVELSIEVGEYDNSNGWHTSFTAKKKIQLLHPPQQKMTLEFKDEPNFNILHIYQNVDKGAITLYNRHSVSEYSYGREYEGLRDKYKERGWRVTKLKKIER